MFMYYRKNYSITLECEAGKKKNKRRHYYVCMADLQMSLQHLHNTENYILLPCRHIWGTGDGAVEAQDSHV